MLAEDEKRKITEVLLILDGGFSNCPVYSPCSPCSSSSERFFRRVSGEVYKVCRRHLHYFQVKHSEFYKEITDGS